MHCYVRVYRERDLPILQSLNTTFERDNLCWSVNLEGRMLVYVFMKIDICRVTHVSMGKHCQTHGWSEHEFESTA